MGNDLLVYECKYCGDECPTHEALKQHESDCMERDDLDIIEQQMETLNQRIKTLVVLGVIGALLTIGYAIGLWLLSL